MDAVARQQAQARVAASATLRPWGRILLDDWGADQPPHRWEWIATAPEEEIAAWAEEINEAAGDEILLSTAEAAEAWGVSQRRALAHVRWLHERSGGEVGRRIGHQWAITLGDCARSRPGKPGRPAFARR